MVLLRIEGCMATLGRLDVTFEGASTLRLERRETRSAIISAITVGLRFVLTSVSNALDRRQEPW